MISQNKVTTDIANNGYGNPTQSVTRNESSSMKILTNTTYTADGAFIDSMYDQDNYVTSYSYNQDKGLLSSVTNAKGNTVSYGYNANTDQLTSVTGSVGGNTVTNSYEYNKNTLTKINHNGFSYNFLYDNYITQVEIDGSKKYLWNADSQGNIIKQEDLINKLLYNYEFDLNGKLIRQSVEDTSKPIGTGRNAYLLEYGYDLNNNVDRFVNKAGSRTLTHTYSYGLDDLLSSYTMPTGKTVTYNYDTLNRLNQYQIGTTTPVTVAYQYASSKRNGEGQSTYRTTKIYQETAGNQGARYTYDQLGNITAISEKQPNGSYEETNSYTYDELNQLTRENDKKH
ncbi:MAG: Rhs family protein, partial [Herbinix sp.]|nr:Rhs family protein [Herbinix sp.]